MSANPRFARRLPLLGLWLLVLIASLIIIGQTRFTADMTAFLPAHPTAEQAFLVDQIQEGTLSKMILIGIDGGDAIARAEAARALGATLRQSGLFSTVQNGNAPALAADQALLFNHRYLLSPAITAQHFLPAELHAAIGNSIDLLASPLGLFTRKIFTQDPTGETFTLVNHLAPQGQNNTPVTRDGVWVSPDGKRALLMLQTRAKGADTDAMASALAEVHTAFEALAQPPASHPQLQLMVTGAPVFAVDSRRLIQADVERFSLIASLAIIGLLLLVYRSLTLVVLSLVPVLTGIMVAIATVSLGFGAVHGITLGFGTTLIGEAIDYSIYYFIQTRNAPRENATVMTDAPPSSTPSANAHDRGMARFWPTVRLGVLTSITGFAALLFSGFPGLAQIGLYSIAGLLTAALVTRFVLPHLDYTTRKRHTLAPIGRALSPLFNGARRLRWGFVVLALAAVVLLMARHDAIWQSGLSGLSPISSQAKAEDAALRADLRSEDTRYFIVATEPTQQAALAAAERLDAALKPLASEGVLTQIESPAHLLPSLATQQARQQALPDRVTLTQNLERAVQGLPVQAARLAPFVDAIAQARQQPLLTPKDFSGTDLGLALDSMLQSQTEHGQTHWLALIRLHTPHNAVLDAARINQAIQASGVTALFIDKEAQTTQLFNSYLHNTIALSLAGLLAILIVLGAVLKSPTRLLRVMLPLLIAVVLVMAGLNLAGERLNILNLIGLLLIVAIGSNYALFFNQGKAPDAATLASLALANLTTVIAFGTLAFSDLPILHAFGSTVAPGAVLALLISAAFAEPAHAAA
jgi:predicted exporter